METSSKSIFDESPRWLAISNLTLLKCRDEFQGQKSIYMY
ncbi:hypothetical protein SynRS9902_02807 [Synechococcus sp. RS9902]|nr:hypothetical protein SynRS9902_02807 [Synechococcus sp. RS9902]